MAILDCGLYNSDKMSGPIGYLLTWTCYGTWLHGDERGSVDLENNVYSTPVLEPDESRNATANSRLINVPVRLDFRARETVREAIEECCRFREWRLHAINVRTTHVHVVVEPRLLRAPESILVQLKAWSTRRLRELKLVRPKQRVWTSHGSTRYLWNENSVLSAIDYVLLRQKGGGRAERA